VNGLGHGSCGKALAQALSSILSTAKIHEIAERNNLKGGKIYFGSQFQRFQFMVIGFIVSVAW
jgi:hypothetical protein